MSTSPYGKWTALEVGVTTTSCTRSRLSILSRSMALERPRHADQLEGDVAVGEDLVFEGARRDASKVHGSDSREKFVEEAAFLRAG